MGRQPTRLTLCVLASDPPGLERCLRSAAALADEVAVLCDPALARGVAPVARRFGGRTHTAPWASDFSRARNCLLEKARGEWVLFLDDDEELIDPNPDALAALLETGAEGYFLPVLSPLGDGTEVELEHQVRLFRRRREYRFSGRCCEVLAGPWAPGPGSPAVRAAPIGIWHHGYLGPGLAARAARKAALLQAATGEPDGYRRYCLGREYARLGRSDEAVRHLEQALRQLDAATRLWAAAARTLARLLLGQGRHAQALRVLQEAVGRHPRATDLWFLLGSAAAAAAQHGLARAAFTRCLELGAGDWYYDPSPGTGSYKALYALGAVYESLGDSARSLELYRAARSAARAAGSEFTEPVYRIAALRVQEHASAPAAAPGRTPAVQAVLSELGTTWELATPADLCLAADVLGTQGRWEEALTCAERAAEAGADGEEAALLRGICLAMLGQTGAALDALRRIPPASPLWPRAALRRLALHWAASDFGGAEALLAELDDSAAPGSDPGPEPAPGGAPAPAGNPAPAPEPLPAPVREIARAAHRLLARGTAWGSLSTDPGTCQATMDALLLWVELLLAAGDGEKAGRLAALLAALPWPPAVPGLAVVAARRGRPELIEPFRRPLLSGTGARAAEACLALGQAYQRGGSPAQALVWYRAAAGAGPGTVQPYVALAGLLRARGQALVEAARAGRRRAAVARGGPGTARRSGGKPGEGWA